MRFINDERVVLAKVRVVLSFGKKDPVRHELHRRRLPRSSVIETNLIANFLPERNLQFFRDTFRDGSRRNPARLRAADPQAIASPPHLERDLRQLGCLSRSRISTNNYDLMLFKRITNVLPPA